MPEAFPLHFGPYRLAGPQGPLFRDDQRLKVKPKALRVLWELVRQAGEVVTKAALLDALWPKAVVGDDALAFQVQALRRVLEDDPRQPRYIATHHRVGYAFIAPVALAAWHDASRLQDPPAQFTDADQQTESIFVGRDAELALVHQRYARVLRGERQLLFVSGEAGIGKSALLQRFVAQVGAAAHIGQGQCVEQHGIGEGYMPVLEALGALCRKPRGAQVVDVLRRAAPSWLMQMSSVLAQDELATLQQSAPGAARARMLREIADALEAIAAQFPLIIVLEDLHWSDPSTIEMLSLVARRTTPARLLLLGTYRRVDANAANRPLKTLKQELVAHGKAMEIVLGNLPRAEVQTYLWQRFPDRVQESGLSAFVYQRTEGLPLFMVQMADFLTQECAPADMTAGLREALEAAVPTGLREMIEAQFERLTELERRVLEIASVAGVEFTAASVGAGAGMPVEDVEACCEGLVRQGQFVEARGIDVWPDGTESGRYGFCHALYRDVLYARLGARQRTRAHLAVGLREQAGHAERSAEIAVGLAVHFERGRDGVRAVHCSHQAGQQALRRSANAEAGLHFKKALALLAVLPATPERVAQELRLQVDLSLALTMTEGYSGAEVEGVNARAQALCRQIGETPEISAALFRVGRFYLVRGELRTARGLSEQLLRIARRAASPALLSRAHTALAFESFSFGEFAAAQAHAELSVASDDPQRYRAAAVVSADDSSAVSLMVKARALQIRGYPDQALRSLHEGVALANGLGLSFARGGALLSTADLHLLRRDSQAVQTSAEATITLSIQEGFPYYVARATILRGWALADQGQPEAGIADIRQGLATFEAGGARLWLPCCLGLLAEAYGRAGKVNPGLRALSEALEIANSTGERQYEPELHRLKGEFALQKSRANRVAAEACFHRAIAVARQQEAKTYELRASLSLARLWLQQGKQQEAHRMLSEILDGFTEGFDAPDLRTARTVLSGSMEERAA